MITADRAEILLHRLNKHSWYPGNDGFGGEYVVSPKDIVAVKNWFTETLNDLKHEGKVKIVP